jgi:hypothetical protein
LSHVDQVSTLRGRACMVTAGCLLASEQLVFYFRAYAVDLRAGGRRTENKKEKKANVRVIVPLLLKGLDGVGNSLRHQASGLRNSE